jgi:pyruvate ferredoxin oxidoreductase beta subunit
MATELKLYQVGTFAAGNRLADPSVRTGQSAVDRANSITSGHRACRGCGEALGARFVHDAVVRAADRDVVTVNATGCLEVFSTPYPESAWQVPWVHSLFGNAPAVASGMAAGLRALGRDHTRVLAQAGDGGTVDIGFGCLSGMFERNDDVLFVCYDNEGYMNTGVQRSAATPPGARTANTKALGPDPGNAFGQGKSVPLIALAHEIPYVATATVADLRDLERKVEYAMSLHGARYLHVLVPCPLGWAARSEDTVRLARLATQSGLFPVFEGEHGQITAVTPIRHRVPVTDYLALQGRFAHLLGEYGRPDLVAQLQRRADHNIARFGLAATEGDPDEA